MFSMAVKINKNLSQCNSVTVELPVMIDDEIMACIKQKEYPKIKIWADRGV